MSAPMNTNLTLLKADSTRGIDRTVDYFGEQRTSAIRRTTWLTPLRRQKPALPAVFLEHPLAVDPLPKLGA
jgi:hypothetical protein